MLLNLGNIQSQYEIHLPKMFKVIQKFDNTFIEREKVQAILSNEFMRPEIKAKIKPGMKIAVAVGSRGICNILDIVRDTISEIKKLGAKPFIVPAMGSHGGATAQGQCEVLESYGITEGAVGAPIRSSMDTVHLGTILSEVDIYFDKIAYEEADGIVAIARIKPHTDFKGPIESGLLKMMSIGLGKHKGASYLHLEGMAGFRELIPAAGMYILGKVPFLFGVAIIENAFDQTAMVEIVAKEQLPQREKELLQHAKQLMPKLLVKEIDVLIVDEIGKNISGAGMDANVIGRSVAAVDEPFDAPPIGRIVVLGLTHETHGNASGIGLADITTKRTAEQIDFHAVYTNVITDIELSGGNLPVTLSNDRQAIEIGIQTARKRNFDKVKVVRIKNTLHIGEIWVSENMLAEVRANPLLEVSEEPIQWEFDDTGHLSL
jgi:hypothetical protein